MCLKQTPIHFQTERMHMLRYTTNSSVKLFGSFDNNLFHIWMVCSRVSALSCLRPKSSKTTSAPSYPDRDPTTNDKRPTSNLQLSTFISLPHFSHPTFPLPGRRQTRPTPPTESNTISPEPHICTSNSDRQHAGCLQRPQRNPRIIPPREALHFSRECRCRLLGLRQIHRSSSDRAFQLQHRGNERGRMSTQDSLL